MLTWHLHRGEVPSGRIVTHLCGNARCVASDHLAALTANERGLLKLALNSRADQVTGCREFTGDLAEGYGVVWHGGRSWLAHRLSWTILRGRIPAGMLLDHLCRNRRCIEPTHLRVTDSGGNNRNVGKPTDERLAAIWDHAEGVEGILLMMG
ncbi:HNH endonuclease [Micropruina sp.]|uniref:HNH endonuclease signature motif containing protein n=1 Tax=Micropruina sp. TaxID=2737536 RepID=UPI0039E553E2